MATVTRFEFTDDIDGKPLDVDNLNVVSWTWLGVEYEFETSTINLDRIENGRVPVATLLTKSRRVGGRKRTPTSKPATAPSSAAIRTASTSANTKTIRTWAQENGYAVNDRGRIAAAVVDAFIAHH